MSPESTFVFSAALSIAFAGLGVWLTAREPDGGWINYLKARINWNDRRRTS